MLEQTLQDVSNLQAEFKHIMEEIGSRESICAETRRQNQLKDQQFMKYGKQSGFTTPSVKEGDLLNDVVAGLNKCKEKQLEKCVLANTAAYVVSKHLATLENKIALLEADEVLAPLEDEEDDIEQPPDNTPNDRKRKSHNQSSTPGAPALKRRKNVPTSMRNRSNGRRTPLQSSDANAGSPSQGSDIEAYQDADDDDDLFSNNIENDDDDKTLYCFCQRVSYGEMVACDGPNCKHEWFHYGCVNLKEPPKGIWYCPECKQEMAQKKARRKK